MPADEAAGARHHRDALTHHTLTCRQQLLRWEAQVTLEEGLRRNIAWYEGASV